MSIFENNTPALDQQEEREYNRLINLLNKCKKVDAFEYEGVFYKGYEVDAVKQFIKENPLPADFHVWLQNNYRQLDERL